MNLFSFNTLANKVFADDNFKFINMVESFSEGQKTLWEKEKLLISKDL